METTNRNGKKIQSNYFTFTGYVNAWSLKKGLRLLDHQLYTKDNTAIMVPYSQDLLKAGDILFFTEENSLLAYQKHLKEYYFYPQNQYDWDDKFRFAQKLQCIKEKPVPGFQHHTSKVQFPIYLKAKRSWYQDKNLPRGFLCQNEAEIVKKLFLMEQKGFHRDLFFLQKYIKNGVNNTFSVCGFFDCLQTKRNCLIILRKVLGTHKDFAGSIVAETIQDPEKLIDRTSAILSFFSFTGPFELEFIFDETTQQYYVLELNPRFWMQHAIFIDFFDNYLIKCYLNLDTESDRSLINNKCYKKIYWVHLDIISFLKMPFVYGKMIFTVLWYSWTSEARVCFYPNVLTSIRYFLIWLVKKLHIECVKKLKFRSKI